MSALTEAIDWLTAPERWSGDRGIPVRLLEHVEYTALTVAVAAVVAVPLGLYIGHTGRLRGIAVAATGAIRALPTLGVLTVFALAVGIGLTAPIAALVLLAIPPILAGVYSGVGSVSAQTVDAARAQGMTELQILRKVEVPLALPIIIGGFRSATLQVVATATVAAYVSLGGLGRYVIDGIRTSDYPQMFGGSVVVVVLALALDGLWAASQSAVTRSRPLTSTSS